MHSALPSRLSDAIRSGDFESAAPLIEQYGAVVKQQMCEAVTLDGRHVIVDEALSFLRDRIHLARTMRAHLATQLRTVARTSCYASASEERTTWHCEG